MATFKEWKRDFYRKSKWDRVMIILKIIGILIAIIGLFYGGKYIIKNFIIGNNNTQVIVEGDNEGQICIESSCELTNQYEIQADKDALHDISYKKYELGMRYKQEGDFEKAKEQFLKVTKLNIDASSAWYKLGYIELYEGNLSGALQYFQNALVGCDEWYSFFYDKKLSFCNSVNLAISDTYFYQKNYQDSIKWINKVEDEYIKFEPPILKFKAQRYMLNGQCEEAKEIYLDFIKLTTEVDWDISKGDKSMLISESIREYCYCKYQLNELNLNEVCEIKQPIEAKFTPSNNGGSTSFVDAPINNSGAFR